MVEGEVKRETQCVTTPKTRGFNASDHRGGFDAQSLGGPLGQVNLEVGVGLTGVV